MIFCTTRGEEVGMKQKYSENLILPALRDRTFQKGKLYEGDAYLFFLGAFYRVERQFTKA